MNNLWKALYRTFRELFEGNLPPQQKKKLSVEEVKKILPPVEEVKPPDAPNESDFALVAGGNNKLPLKSHDAIQQFVAEQSELVNDYFLACVKRAIIGDLPEIVCFRLGESRLMIKLESKNYPDLLEQLQKFYLTKEQYEKVAVCKKLLEKYFINKLIGESTY